jgi:hypothetical protein
VPRLELLARAHVDHDHRAATSLLEQLVVPHRIERVPLAEVGIHDAVDVRQARPGQPSDEIDQLHDALVGEAVVDARAIAPGRDEARRPQHLQMR